MTLVGGEGADATMLIETNSNQSPELTALVPVMSLLLLVVPLLVLLKHQQIAQLRSKDTTP